MKKIFYFVQSHADGANAAPLARFLSAAGDYVFISADCPGPSVDQLSDEFRGFDNIEIVKSTPVTWCGWSQAQAMLFGMCRFLNSDSELFVNLTGRCVPLHSLEAISETIWKAIAKPNTALCYHFKPNLAPIYDEASTSEYERIQWPKRNITLYVDKACAPLFAKIHESPVVFSERRASFWASEISSEKAIQIDVASQDQRDLIESVRPKYVLGRAYFGLTREITTKLLQMSASPGRWQVFRNLFEPDEAFFPSLLAELASAENAQCNLISKNFHLAFGDPSAQVTSVPIEKLRNSDALFGRKYFPGVSKDLDEYLSSIGYGGDAGA